MFQMHPDKLPGPDEMTHVFFLKYSKIVGGDVVQLVDKFFKDEVLLGGTSVD